MSKQVVYSQPLTMSVPSDGLFSDCFSQLIMSICDFFRADRYRRGICMLYRYSVGTTTPIGIHISQGVKMAIPELMNISGVHYLSVSCESKLSEQIIEHLEEGCPVLLYIDGFYDANSKFSFGRVHLRHYILVHGYDPSIRQFYIIGHDYANESRFEQRKIEYRELERCYYGGLAFYCHKERPAYYKFFRQKSQIGSTQTFRFLQDYRESLLILEKFFRFFESCLENKVSENYLDSFFNNYTEVSKIKRKLYNFYRQQKSSKPSLQKTVKAICESWEALCAQLKQYSRQSGTWKENITEMKNYTAEILEEEEKLVTEMEEFFQ